MSLPPTVAAMLVLAASATADDAGTFADNACVQCHRDLPGRSSEIVELEWRHSVHFDAGVTCDGCHGGDAGLSPNQFETRQQWKEAAHLQRDPEFTFMFQPEDRFVSAARGRSVSYFCGKCHADIKEKHLGSPHGEFGDPTCLYCHGRGSHLIEDPTLELIDTRDRSEGGRCSPCHRASSMESVERIKTLLVKTENDIESSGELYAELEAWGYRSLELEELHHHARQVRSQLRQIFHSFNMLDINNFVGEISQVVEQTQGTYELVTNLRRSQRRQTAIGASVVALLLAFAGLLVYYKNTFLHG